MASDGSDPDTEYPLSKLLQMGTIAEYQNEFEMLIKRVTTPKSLLKSFYISGLKPALQCALFRSNPKTLEEAFSLAMAAEARFTDLQLWEHLRSNPSTLREAFFRARINEARFDDEINQAVDTIAGDQEDPNVKDKQEVKKVDDQEIENIKDEEGKNVEDHQVFERDDNTNNADVGYIEDEPGFLAHEIDYPNDNDARDQASELETKVLEDGKQDDMKVMGVTDEQNNGKPNVLEGNTVIGVGVNKINKCFDKEVQYVVSTLHVFIPLLKPFNDKHIKKIKMKVGIQRRIWNPGIKIF
ncbi:hypothetical protein Tco_0838740 [Tanacetum coccineum]|uniref:Retrotransposon gag domain-containing protein n=1 Tax=Tanacetum coccineum TaxID=301880 RepID=A0ABQ5ASW6_9ASTR